MSPKSSSNHYKSFLILAQIGVLLVAMVFLFWLMVLSNKQRVEDDLKARLDISTQAMAAQLKANQVPFSSTNVEPGVFIINQTDGTVVVDRRNEGDAEQKLWEGYKTKIIYEMQKQKRGWIEYPDKNAWNFNEPQRIIRYISIDELNWILAVEDLQPSSLDLLKESVTPGACLMIFFIFIFGAGALWLLTLQYFDLIKRQISDSLEGNILSMNGEEKIWDKSHGQVPEFSRPAPATAPVTPSPPVAAPVAVADPIMEEIFQKTPTKPIISPVLKNIVLSHHKEEPKEILKEIPKETPAHTEEANDKAVNVQHIHSPALKKILQQFREK